ncbi:O-antigen ligase family protein [Bombilactobacillus thymidiniphilus]|uniref:O-antigen ligase family protein n=1 Tax=Bombilactobacillus thymidiniphilus TaxID=2923363 RepID=A0ABY4PC06_9LACO|nr:O-antigen ligase family protein [Bombilactobacillus thymidiniphilus]UQS83222.1 O-antigen ligase family protein [Bombilactobacillus thymidiniphilus]
MKKKQLQNFGLFLIYFVILQPVLDVITGWQVKLMPHFGLTIGVLVRAIVLLAVICFVVFAAKENSNWLDRLVPWYLVTLLVFIIVNLVVSKFNKPVFSLTNEGVSTFKTINYLLIFLGMYYALRNLKIETVRVLVPKVIYWAVMIINIVMIGATLTHSGFNTYPQGKVGQSGWFNAGNELGAILAISFPIILLYAINYSYKHGRYWHFIGVFLTVSSVVMLGTKSCFYGMIIGLIFALVYLVIKWFTKTKNGKRSQNSVNILLIMVTFIGIGMIYPKSPVHMNSAIQADIIKDNQANKKKIIRDKKEHKHMDHYEKFLIQNKELSNPLVAKLLSGRTNYFRVTAEQYTRAPVAQKLFGLGVGGNYKNRPRTIEMDLFDLYFQFGIIGSILTILPLVGLILYLAFYFVRYLTKYVIQDNLLYFVAFGLGLFMSILSGHVLNAPGVSIYFGLVAAYLVNQLEYFSQNKKRY